jgi:hypothetical protein
MYVKIGTDGYQHAAAEAGVTFSVESVRSPRGYPIAHRKRMDISGLLIPTSGETNMSAAITALENAYTDENLTANGIALYHTDGTITPHNLPVTNKIGIIRVVQKSFPNRDEVYANSRRFSVTVEAEYKNPLEWPALLFFTETIQLIGTGGPNKILVDLVQGLPDYQETSTNTQCRATQSGIAMQTDTFLRPEIDARTTPWWPDSIQEKLTNITYSGPERRNGYMTNYTSRWSYHFLANQPFNRVINPPSPHRV